MTAGNESYDGRSRIHHPDSRPAEKQRDASVRKSVDTKDNKENSITAGIYGMIQA